VSSDATAQVSTGPWPAGIALTATAFAAVYDQHVSFVWRCARHLGAPALVIEDVVQDVFIAVYERLPAFEGRSSLKTWLFAITLRVVRRYRQPRADGGTAEAPLEAALVEHPDSTVRADPYEVLIRQEAAHLVNNFLDSLDDKKRTVFVLAEIEQWTASEIAEALGTNVNTIYSRLRLAREAFRVAIDRSGKRAKRGSI